MKQQNHVQQEMKPFNYKQLASIYEVSHKTLKSWLEPFAEEIGAMRGRFFTLKQVRIIFEKLGQPKNLEMIDESGTK